MFVAEVRNRRLRPYTMVKNPSEHIFYQISVIDFSKTTFRIWTSFGTRIEIGKPYFEGGFPSWRNFEKEAFESLIFPEFWGYFSSHNTYCTWLLRKLAFASRS